MSLNPNPGPPFNVAAILAGINSWTGTNTFAGISIASGSGIDYADASSLAVSASGHGRLRYNNTTGVFEQSLNGGAWSTLGGGTFTGSIASTQIAVGSGTNAIGGSTGLTWDAVNGVITAIGTTGNYGSVIGGTGGIYISDSSFGGSGMSATTTQARLFNTYKGSSISLGPTTGVIDVTGQFSISDGIKLVTSSTTAIAGGLRYNGTNLQGSDNGSTWTNLLGGGASTGNYVFSGNTVDLSASGTMTIGGTNTTAVKIPGTLVATGAITVQDGTTGFTSLLLDGSSSTLKYGGFSLIIWGSGIYVKGGAPFYTEFDMTAGQTLGRPTNRWAETWSGRYAGAEQTIAAAASITLDPASGESIRINLGATGITTVNGAAGYPGESIKVKIVQDATGSRTIAGWASGTNGFKFTGGTFITGSAANNIDILTFVWDVTLSMWVESGRSSVPVAASLPVPAYFDIVQWMRNYDVGGGTVGTAGANSNGMQFTADRSITVTGCRWYQPPGYTGSVKVNFFIGATLSRTVTVTPTANAVNTAMFATAVSIVNSSALLTMTVQDGANQLLYITDVNISPIGLSNFTPGLGIFYLGNGYGSLNTTLTGTSGQYPGLLPIYTIP